MRLLDRHPELQVTLCATPDWREITPFPTRLLVNRVPVVRDRVHLTRLRPKGAMSLSSHPDFVSYLKGLPQTEVALHGLHHVHPGRTILIEFQKQSVDECREILAEDLAIFEAAGLDRPAGMTPPGWNAPPNLIKAMGDLGFDYLTSARDILTPVARDAKTNMSGLKGVSLIYPELLPNGLVHLSANFQATSERERAFEILEAGGVLSIKSHIVKHAYGHTALDGVDQLYMNYLDLLIETIKGTYGDSIWWPSVAELANRVSAQAQTSFAGPGYIEDSQKPTKQRGSIPRIPEFSIRSLGRSRFLELGLQAKGRRSARRSHGPH